VGPRDSKAAAVNATLWGGVRCNER
jgi:hypothetical protein